MRAGDLDLEASRFEVAVMAEELACGELLKLVRATVHMFTGDDSSDEEERELRGRRGAQHNTGVHGRGRSAAVARVAPQRQPPHLYVKGDLVHATTLRLMLLLGRCCALIATGNRERGWHIPAEAVARLNNWTGDHGRLRASEMAGCMGGQAQGKALREGGAEGAAAYAEQESDTFVLVLESGDYTLPHPAALRACGFELSERAATPPPGYGDIGFEVVLTLRRQAAPASQSAALQPTAQAQRAAASRAAAAEREGWERYSYANLTGLTFPGCHNFGCSSFSQFSEAAVPTLLCSGCRRARYCSTACQRAAWLHWGHSVVCAELKKVVRREKAKAAESAAQRAEAADREAFEIGLRLLFGRS